MARIPDLTVIASMLLGVYLVKYRGWSWPSGIYAACGIAAAALVLEFSVLYLLSSHEDRREIRSISRGEILKDVRKIRHWLGW